MRLKLAASLALVLGVFPVVAAVRASRNGCRLRGGQGGHDQGDGHRMDMVQSTLRLLFDVTDDKGETSRIGAPNWAIRMRFRRPA